MLSNLCVNTCETIKANIGLHAGNSSRRFLDGARGGTFKILGPCEGTMLLLMAAIKLSLLETAMMLLLLLLLEMATKLLLEKGMVCSKKDGISMQFS